MKTPSSLKLKKYYKGLPVIDVTPKGEGEGESKMFNVTYGEEGNFEIEKNVPLSEFSLHYNENWE